MKTVKVEVELVVCIIILPTLVLQEVSAEAGLADPGLLTWRREEKEFFGGN